MTFETSGSGSMGATASSEPKTHTLDFDTSDKGSLIGLHLVNVIFMALTLLIYRFWAITRVRRALWPRMRLDSLPLEYTGTGLEIFLGFLKVFVLILLPYGIFSNWANSNIVNPELGFSLGFAFLSSLSLLGLAFLYAAGRYLAYRYRINRTQWRSLRGSVDGAAYMYGLMSIGCYFLVFVSFGVLKPWMDVKLLQYRWDHTKFGGQQFWFAGTTEGLWRPYLLFLLMNLVVLAAFINIDGSRITIGFNFDFSTEDSTSSVHWQSVGIVMIGATCSALAYLNYQIQFWKRAASRVTFGAARFSFAPKLHQVLGLYVGNWFIVCFTFWILLPFIWLRKGTFLAQHLEIVGDLNLDKLVQSDLDTNTTGEGLLGDFDIA
ncbi:YjgN family protein [Nisaea acidiphila]|uniref:YjgN family protein n=1 Tax=Nisaea acidiphila TaxID=1862145 RepID=A0A9J7AYD6_9PROT|nr:YjgN family protein [Nisaea acidiphila]UUX51284.1 YjgN family protein [Nisaea acidiphila]